MLSYLHVEIWTNCQVALDLSPRILRVFPSLESTADFENIIKSMVGYSKDQS